MTDLSSWATGELGKENPEDPWDWVAGQRSCVFVSDSKSQFPQLKHLEKPSMYHIGLFVRRATWILFIVLNLRFDADDCLLSH